MTDMYQGVISKYKGQPSIVLFFLISCGIFGIGVNHFIEDTYSSKIGLETIESVYAMNVQIFDWSYWTMSLAPQFASMFFAYIFFSDTTKKWAIWASLGCQVVDFLADSWYRSNSQLFNDPLVFAISSVITIAYFSVGSELFITLGGGFILKLFAPALQTFKMEMKNIMNATKGNYAPAGQGGGGGERPGGGGKPGEVTRHPIRPDIAQKMGMRREGDIRPPMPEVGMTPVDRSQMGKENGGGNNGGDTGKFHSIPRGNH